VRSRKKKLDNWAEPKKKKKKEKKLESEFFLF